MNRLGFRGGLTALALVLLLSGQTGWAQDQSKWKLTKGNHSSFEELWAADSCHIAANECGEAYFDAPVCKDLKEGDCWILHVPVSERFAPAGKPLRGGLTALGRKPARGLRPSAGRRVVRYFVEFDLMLGNMIDTTKRFAVEYLDGRKWRTHSEIKCVGGTNEPIAIIETIPFRKKPAGGEAIIRLRALDSNPCQLKIMPYGYIGAYAAVRETATLQDTLKVAYLGNSFTYVNCGDFILKELAWYEGLFLDMHVSTYPGASFRSHLGLEGSLDVLSEGGYDWLILQDQSQQAAKYGRDAKADILNYTKSVSSVARYFSPDTQILYEQTWSYEKDEYGGFGSHEYFDECSALGAQKISEAVGAVTSPIAVAWAIVRAERPDIVIYSTDDHHPADYGAYLKACVNYLQMTGRKFTSDRANFALDPAICAYLRSVAERVCLPE